MKTAFLVFALLFISVAASAQDKAFLGKWDIMGDAPNQDVVYWLEVTKGADGKITGQFLNRGGSVYKLPSITLEKGELVFKSSNNPDAWTHKAKVVNGQLKGTGSMGKNTINWTGVRPPKWGNYNANGKHKFGTPVSLFNGKDVDNWDFQIKSRPKSWRVVDGIMMNDAHGNNLISQQKFTDFKINCEYKLEDKSNSGIYLRGRYELQVLDDFGAKQDGIHSHMAIYSRVAPKVMASKKPGEWQEMEAIIVGNRVTVKLNGQLVHDNVIIEGITGGALDAKEGEPGPIMIQGDHEKVAFRKIVVTPIIK